LTAYKVDTPNRREKRVQRDDKERVAKKGRPPNPTRRMMMNKTRTRRTGPNEKKKERGEYHLAPSDFDL